MGVNIEKLAYFLVGRYDFSVCDSYQILLRVGAELIANAKDVGGKSEV